MKFTKPTLLLDRQTCLTNISLMKAKADDFGLIFRPHFKTHQSTRVGEWFKDFGIDKITVSSVGMARYFVNNGWKDITIAFPVNWAEIDDIDKMASEIQLNVLVENPETVAFLGEKLENQLGVFIKIDAGYHRTGLDVEDHAALLNLVLKIKHTAQLNFKGFVVHNGHTYHASGRDEILDIHNNSLQKIADAKRFMEANGISARYSIGDTPAMSLSGNFENIDEIRPGNFVFYDAMQQNLGACEYSNIAVALACPVVAKHEARKELVIYGGAVHLSKDFILTPTGEKCFGKVVDLTRAGWTDPVAETFLKSLSQEHGIIQASDLFFDKTGIGDFIGVLPVHSCLTVDAMGEMVTLNGERITTMKCCDLKR